MFKDLNIKVSNLTNILVIELENISYLSIVLENLVITKHLSDPKYFSLRNLILVLS